MLKAVGRAPIAPMRTLLEAAHNAADRREPRQVGLELGRVRRLGVQRRQRVGNAVLLQVVADRHLAAEAVAAEGDATSCPGESGVA